MIQAYSDTALSDNHATCTSFILTDTNYLGCFTNIYDRVKGSIHGELLGIKQSLDYIKTLNIDDKDVVIFTDSNEAIMHIKQQTKSKHFVSLIEDINTYNTMYNISFQYIKGHAIEHSPNKIVDLIAKSVNTVIKT